MVDLQTTTPFLIYISQMHFLTDASFSQLFSFYSQTPNHIELSSHTFGNNIYVINFNSKNLNQTSHAFISLLTNKVTN